MRYKYLSIIIIQAHVHIFLFVEYIAIISYKFLQICQLNMLLIILYLEIISITFRYWKSNEDETRHT